MSEAILPIEASPEEIQRRIDVGETLVLIDVREPEEFAITRIEGATLIPMRDIPASLQQLEAQADENHIDCLLPPRSTQLERGAMAAGAGCARMPEHDWRYRCLEHSSRPVGPAVLTFQRRASRSVLRRPSLCEWLNLGKL